MEDYPLHLVFAGGGTGGHLFPGLAVAEHLAGRMPQIHITFAGSGKQFEREHVIAAGFEYLGLPCQALPKSVRETICFVARNVTGHLAARRFLLREQVDGVVGLGGYASAAMAWAASRRGLPLVLLEQNAVPGRATRWLAPAADLVCAAMKPTRSNLPCRCPVHVTGNPIYRRFERPESRVQSPEISALNSRLSTLDPRPSTLDHRLLVLGGSGGARALNENVPRALHKIRRELNGWQIVHQSGESGFESTRELYRRFNLPAKVVAFLANLPDVLAATDLAVCRAGGSTLFELAAAGVPAVLLPYPQATDDHQRHNADAFAVTGGCVTLDQRELSGRLPDHLAGTLSGLLEDPLWRARMSAAIRRLARPNAAADVASLILELIGRKLSCCKAPAAA